MDQKRDWMKTVTLVLCAALLIVNLWQGKRLSELERDVRNAQNSIMDDIRSVHSSLGSQLESADGLVGDWDFTTDMDVEKRCLLINVSMALKEWREDTAVEAVWTNLWGSGGEDSVTLSDSGTGTYSGTLELSLAELSGEVALDAVIQNGDIQRREDLGNLGAVSELLPLQCYNHWASGPVYEKDTNRTGRLTLPECGAELHGKAEERISGAGFRLTRNGETVMEQAAELGDRIDSYTCGELSAECRTGDELTLTFFCRDGDGLGYEFCLNGWTIDEGGLTETGPGWACPKLTWD